MSRLWDPWEGVEMTYPPPDTREGSNMAPQITWTLPTPVHKQTPEEFWDRIAQIEQHDPYNKRWKPKEPETHVDRIVMESFSDRQRGDKLLGRYPNADHPDDRPWDDDEDDDA